MKAVERAGGGTRGGEKGDLGKAETLKFCIEESTPETDLAESVDFTVIFIRRERRSRDRWSKIIFAAIYC